MTGQTGRNPVSGDASVGLFVASFLLEGLQRCTGVLFSGILELSDETREAASIPFVVSRATAYIASVASKVSSPKTPDEKEESPIFYGTLLCALGAGLSFISNDVIWLTACWGVLFGVGIGIAFPESLKVSQKFRSQSFFPVMYSASSSFACMVLPFLMQVLITSYGVMGCLLVLSGVILNAIPFILASMYRVHFQIQKPKWRIRKKYNMKDSQMNGSAATNNDETASGVVNEAFEPENSDSEPENGDSEPENGSSEIKTNSSNICAASVDKSKDSELSTNNTLRTSDTIYHNTDSHSRSLTKFPQKSLSFKKSSLLKRSKTMDDELSDEDVLFEVVSENNTIQLGIRKSDADSNTITTNVLIEDRSSGGVSRKRTVSFPSKHLTIDIDEPSSSESPPNDHPVSPTSKSSEGVPSAVRRNFPLEIKVHVVECTLTANDLQNPRKGYRRHSNSLVTSCYENVDFTNPQFLKKYTKPSSLCGNISSRMGLISEDEEYSVEPQSPRCDSSIQNNRQPKTKRCSKIKKLFRPSCLVIIYAYVIYELTLVTLLTIFDDILPQAEIDEYLADSVLPTFGLGGIVGRLSLRYWGDRLLIEGSHATAAVLFILDGVVVAGILWSPNYYWIMGFYTILGFLEVGILTSVWNLVSDYIEPEVRSTLFTTCTFVCGICTLCVPYTIGVSRDDLGEYDALLQVTSALPVLCALLCYILPRFATHSRRVRGS